MGELLSPYLLAIVAAWFLSHVVKQIIAMIKKEERTFKEQLFSSGGMPSAHAATSLAVWTVILLKDGVNSGLFGLATLVVLIVTYDAMKVRRSSGEQGAAVTILIKETKSAALLPRVSKGHTPLEVAFGELFGIAVGLIVFFATK